MAHKAAEYPEVKRHGLKPEARKSPLSKGQKQGTEEGNDSTAILASPGRWALLSLGFQPVANAYRQLYREKDHLLTNIRFFSCAMLTSFTLLAAGCHQAATPSTAPGQPSQTAASFPPVTGTMKVALLTTGPVTDGGWNQSAYEGLTRIQKTFGAHVAKQENLKSDAAEGALRDYARQGYNIIFVHAAEFSDVTAKVAAQFPQVVFVTTGGDNTAANLTALHFSTEEGTYLQGMEAGMVSKTGKGGFIGGEKIPPVAVAADAFAKGAKAVNPKYTFQTTYINSWTDASAAKAQTDALLNSGADTLAHNCDDAAKGMFQTATGKPGVYTFGVNADENKKASNVLSSVFLDVPKAFTDIATSVKNGTFRGQALPLGLKENDVRLIDNPALAAVIPVAGKAKIRLATQDIAAGKLSVAGS